jgi:transcriptional regulator GlxA family with amidase domain
MTSTGSSSSRRRIGILVFDGVKMLDFAGPAEVFVEANQTTSGYEVVLLSPDGEDVQTSIGARVGVAGAAVGSGAFDTIVIPGSELHPTKFVTSDVLLAAKHLAANARRVTSICSGAFVLAALGLLDGRRATTHWKFADDLAHRYPDIDVEPDSIFVRSGHIYSSAGVAAGMDLALALVEEDHGAAAARRVAQSLLVHLQRAGGQSQFSAALQTPAPRTPIVRSITDLVSAEPGHPYTVAELAAHVRVSPRHLTRLFRSELDSSPAEYVGLIRFGVARDMLDAGHTVAESARAAGYGSCEAMRRVFVARLGIAPRKYQQRFRSTVSAGPAGGHVPNRAEHDPSGVAARSAHDAD